MRYFDRILSTLIVLAGCALFFLPKFNILSLDPRQTAGIRIDDGVLLIVGILFMWAHFFARHRFYDIEKKILIITLFSILSLLFNRLFLALGWMHHAANPLFCLRLLEYFIFFYIGMLAQPLFRLSSFLKLFLSINLILMVLQRIGLVGGVTSLGGYVSLTHTRVVGVASFAGEAACFLAMLFGYFLYRLKHHLQQFPVHYQDGAVYLLFFLFAVPIAFTESRIGLFSIVVLLLIHFWGRVSKENILRVSSFFIFLFIGSLGLFFVIMNTPDLIARSSGLLSSNNYALLSKLWNIIDINTDYLILRVKIDSIHDISWGMRAVKWIYGMKLLWSHPECYLQGVGAGVLLAAVDGGFIRIIVEYGIIGLCLFWWLFRGIEKKFPECRWMMWAFYLNMIFIDVYLAYKVMALIFFTVGYLYSDREYEKYIPLALSKVNR